MHKVAVIGSKSSVYGFQTLGVDVYFADDYKTAQPLLKKFCSNNVYAIVFVSEHLASLSFGDINRYTKNKSPEIVLIPDVTGNTGQGMQAVTDCVIKAIGSDIFNN